MVRLVAAWRLSAFGLWRLDREQVVQFVIDVGGDVAVVVFADEEDSGAAFGLEPTITRMFPSRCLTQRWSIGGSPATR
jgi:hypothetical protein